MPLTVPNNWGVKILGNLRYLSTYNTNPHIKDTLVPTIKLNDVNTLETSY